jgi:4-methylaminobutanoate oxidase (formaldehyde-forming)
MAVRTGSGLFDLSPFGKIRVEGGDAEAVLQRVCANDVAVAPGRIVYTQWLNERGGIEADVTVTRLAPGAYQVVTSPTTIRRDLAWLKRHIPEEARCTALDVSSGEACLALMGPNSRRLLEVLTPDDISNAALPFASQRTIELGMAHVRVHRISYVGELGFELYVPTEFARHLWTILLEAGASCALRSAGILAMDTLRLEKAFRHFGHDISEEDHVLEAGLGLFVKTEKASGRFGEFIGREAVLRSRHLGPRRRLLQFKLLDPEPLLFRNEPVLRDGRIVGFLSSGGYGHALGAAIGLGYVPCRADESAQDLLASRFEIEVAGRRFAATATVRPLYDPAGERMRS